MTQPPSYYAVLWVNKCLPTLLSSPSPGDEGMSGIHNLQKRQRLLEVRVEGNHIAFGSLQVVRTKIQKNFELLLI